MSNVTTFISTLGASAQEAAAAPSGISFNDVLAYLQKAAYGVVGYLSSGKAGIDPNAIETAALAYVQGFYITILAPLEIANIPGGAMLAPVLQGVFMAAATNMIHAAVQLVFHNVAATSGPGAPSSTPFSAADAMIEFGNS